jgi:hypothetical protein
MVSPLLKLPLGKVRVAHAWFPMTSRRGLLVAATVLFTATLVRADAPSPAITSIVTRGDEMFVTTPTGIYRGSRVTRTWEEQKLPAEMPLGGQFAKEPPGAKQLYYFAIIPPGTNAPGKLPGIYSSADGRAWQLVKRANWIFEVLVLSDESIYSLGYRDSGATSTSVEVSNDLGKTWRDITNNGENPQGILQDRDHPELITILVSGLSATVMRADDDKYIWKAAEALVGGNKGRLTAAEFFDHNDINAFGEGKRVQATLGNYFGRSFGQLNRIPAFDVISAQPNYEFRSTEKKSVEIHLTFDPDHEQNTAIIDSDDQREFWSSKIIDPEGRQKLSAAPRSTSQPSTLPHSPPLFKTITIDRQHPYVRSIDLGALADFNAPGKYSVQLCYDDWNRWAHEPDWSGWIDGEVFTVTIVK